MFRVVGAVLAALVGFFAVAVTASWVALAAIRPMVEGRLSAALGCQVRYGGAWLTPAAGVVVSGFQIVPAGGQPHFSISRVVLQYEWKDLVFGRWDQLKQVTFYGPQMKLSKGDAASHPKAKTLPSPQIGSFRPINPIRIAVRNGGISVPGLASFVSGGSMDADWDENGLVIREARARVLDADLRAQGDWIRGGEDPRWSFDFILRHPKFSGQLEIDGDPSGSDLAGYWKVADENHIPMSGHMIFSPHRIEAADIQVGVFQATTAFVDFMEQQWSFTVLAPAQKHITVRSRGSWKEPQCEVVVSDFSAGRLTITTTAQLTASLSPDGKGLDGTATTVGSSINQKSLGELAGSWTLTKDSLSIESLTLGHAYRLAGSIGIAQPYPVQLTLDILGADIGEVATTIEPGRPPLASGMVNGQIQIAGSLASMQMKGYLSGRDGKIGRTPFEVATVNFEGEGSVIRFLDSRIQQAAGKIVILEGALDVSKLGTQTVFQQVRLIPLEQIQPPQGPPPAVPPQDFQVSVRKYLDSEGGA